MNKLFLALVLLLNVQAFAATAIGGRAPFKKLEIICKVTGDESKTVEATGYANSPSSDLLFAKVTVYQYSANQPRKSKIAAYHMKYVQPQGLSLVFEFKNPSQKTNFEVFGDDMGGMSSLVIGDSHMELTCEIVRY